MAAIHTRWRTLGLGVGVGILLFSLLAILAKLARTFVILRYFARVVDMAVRPVLIVTERIFGQSPLAAVGILALLCVGAGVGLALIAQWLGRRRQ